MLKIVLLIFFSLNIFALELSLQGAKENHQPYSTLHIRDQEKFLCEEFYNEFNAVIKIVCAFKKAPSQKIKALQNSFFSIHTQVKKKTFFLTIKPYEKMKLFPIIFDLTQEDTLFSADAEFSKHWMIVGYKEKMPYIEKHKYGNSAINFPFTFFEDHLPYVGSLDINGNPVHIKKVGDVKDYVKIKQYYKEEKYELTLDTIDDVMQEYPNSLFRAELLFYKIRAHAKLKEYDTLIETAKEYLREYSSDENVAEVLSLLANSYAKLGMNSDAEYFFDRLFSEHPNSLYAYWGYIYLAEVYEESGSSSKAEALYEKVLLETDDLQAAAEAAFKLAQVHLSYGRIEEAALHINKVIQAKPDYFSKENTFKSIDMMYSFADNSEYESAALLAKAIFEHMNPNEDEYEELARNAGIWLSKTQRKKEALEALNRYLELFSDGMYAQEVQVAKDSLFFDVNDANATVKLATYEKLMEEYQGDTIADKAIYEKARLLLAQKKFTLVLQMQQQLQSLSTDEYKDIAEIITQAAVGSMKQALESKECNRVLVISSEYNIELSDKWDDGVYECAMKGADFTLAKKIADKNLNSKDLNERKKWLYRYIKIDFATGNYSDVIEASKELITLIRDKKESRYKDIYRYLFDTYHRLENKEKMIETIVELQKIFQDDYRDIERYIAIMSLGSEINDGNLVIEYGQKVMQIQKKSDSYAQSPFVEFALYQAYSDKEDYDKALEVIESLETVELSKNQRARQKYLLGSVLEKLWRDAKAKKAYQEAIDADPASAWAELAKSAKAIE